MFTIRASARTTVRARTSSYTSNGISDPVDRGTPRPPPPHTQADSLDGEQQPVTDRRQSDERHLPRGRDVQQVERPLPAAGGSPGGEVGQPLAHFHLGGRPQQGQRTGASENERRRLHHLEQ